MPDRLAANGWQQALSIQNKKNVPREHFSPQDTHHALRTNFVLDEFAPGVLPDTSPPVPPAAAAVKTAPAAPTKKASTSPPAKNLSKPVQTVKEGVEKATGFGDTIVQVGESDEDKLKEEVQHLKAMNVHEKRQFEKREKVDIEHNLLSLEAKQLHSSSSTPSPASSAPTQSSAGKSSATSIGLSASAEDEHAKLVLVGAKGDGKKVLGLLKDAEEARKAQEIAWVCALVHVCSLVLLGYREV
jgi:transcriptional regulator of acetoin/glycerol metabolism